MVLEDLPDLQVVLSDLLGGPGSYLQELPRQVLTVGDDLPLGVCPHEGALRATTRNTLV